MFVASAELRDHPAQKEDWDTELHVPSRIVGPSEKRLIAERLDAFAKKLLVSRGSALLPGYALGAVLT